ncbi:MAG TPA: PhzF family phenazine biosynthesis protein [Terriglobales bacterium]|nr:PhzF family phenazine biosynthesis protein [Terriglobales bacterium]
MPGHAAPAEAMVIMRKFPYALVDVFTSVPLAGNQLAVVTQSGDLTDTEMQALAKETNLSETTFIVQRDPFVERERGMRVRIFTPAEELPFAGHPTLGTAAYLRTTSSFPIQRVELELNVGKITVLFEERENGPAFGEMLQREPEFGSIHSREDVARMAGLDRDDFHDDLPVQTVSTGMKFAIAPVRTMAAMRRLGERFVWQRALEYLKKSDAKFIYFVCKETDSDQAHIHARMFFYNGEDPATGSAAGCAAAWMVKYGVAASGERVMIEQGVEMGRPSEMYVRAESQGDKVVNVRVGGHAVVIAHGEFQLP